MRVSDEYKEMEREILEYIRELPLELGVKDLESFNLIRDILDCMYYDGRTLGNLTL